MKISQLLTAFQKFAEPQDRPVESVPAPARPALPAPARVEATPPDQAYDDDIVTVSPEAVFLFAASQFDPQRISRVETAELADTLRDGGAISPQDHAILSSPPGNDTFAGAIQSDPSTKENLVSNFQGKLAYDMARSDIAAVEADTRALAILGRLSSIREEIL